MKPINGMAGVLVLGFATLFLLACENRMERAKRSLDEISYEVAGALPDGERFVPTETAHVQQEVADLQGAYHRKDYAAVLARAPAVLADVKSLATDAAAKKSRVAKALDEQWSVLVATLPGWIAAVEDRLAALSKPRRASKGMDLSTAKSALADAKDGWERAQAAMATGESADAIATARNVKAETEAAAVALELKLPSVGQ
jgi:hypothetical protein